MTNPTGVNVFPGAKPGTTLSPYKYSYSTGPFLLPTNPGTLNLALLNNDTTQQKIAIQIWKCDFNLTTAKTLLSGPFITTLNQGQTAAYWGPYPGGVTYEVQVLCNSQLILPYVSVWTALTSYTPIAGSVINSGSFVRLMP